MRTRPLIGRKAWFGPRRFGWGLSPVTAEGWAVTVIGLAIGIALIATVSAARWVGFIVMAAVVAVAFLKGTSPGGSAAWSAWRNDR